MLGSGVSCCFTLYTWRRNNAYVLRAVVKVGINCPWVHALKEKNGNDGGSLGSVTILQCVPRYGDEGVSAMVRVAAPRWSASELARSVQGAKGVREASFTEVGPDIFLGIVKTSNCPCSKTPLPRLNILSISTGDDGELYWTILVNNHGELHEVLGQLDRMGIRCVLCEVERLREAWAISAKQAMLLERALRSGFYDNPRKVTLKELAESFNISPRAVAETLRRAHKKIIHQALEIGQVQNIISNRRR